jgi:hypothetical protein
MPKPFREQDDSRSRRRKARGTEQKADWLSVAGDVLQAAIASVSNHGGAIRFGYTRNGSAYAIGILGDGEPYTDYLRPSEDVTAYLEELIASWSDEVVP